MGNCLITRRGGGGGGGKKKVTEVMPAYANGNLKLTNADFIDALEEKKSYIVEGVLRGVYVNGVKSDIFISFGIYVENKAETRIYKSSYAAGCCVKHNVNSNKIECLYNDAYIRISDNSSTQMVGIISSDISYGVSFPADCIVEPFSIYEVDW